MSLHTAIDLHDCIEEREPNDWRFGGMKRFVVRTPFGHLCKETNDAEEAIAVALRVEGQADPQPVADTRREWDEEYLHGGRGNETHEEAEISQLMIGVGS